MDQGVIDALPVLVDQLERLKHKEAPTDYSSRRITRLLEPGAAALGANEH